MICPDCDKNELVDMKGKWDSLYNDYYCYNCHCGFPKKMIESYYYEKYGIEIWTSEE